MLRLTPLPSCLASGQTLGYNVGSVMLNFGQMLTLGWVQWWLKIGSKMPPTIDNDAFENLPDDIAGYLVPSSMKTHPTGLVRWAHVMNSLTLPHSHVINDNWNPDLKNQMAEHIEHYHKPKRRTDASG